jgi:hypothetical protein
MPVRTSSGKNYAVFLRKGWPGPEANRSHLVFPDRSTLFSSREAARE